MGTIGSRPPPALVKAAARTENGEDKKKKRSGTGNLTKVKIANSY